MVEVLRSGAWAAVGFLVLAAVAAADPLRGVAGEGLLLKPTGRAPAADVVAIPDADQTPEMIAGLVPGVPAESQFARRLAESGCRVVIPTLIDRSDTFSVTAGGQKTNQP